MFKPIYNISDYFLSLVEQIVQLSTLISAANVELSTIVQLQREAFDRNAHASTSIEGNELSLIQVASLADNNDILADAIQKIEVTNYFMALRWVMTNNDKQISESRILNLHKLVSDNLLDRSKVGVYKNNANYVVDANKIIIYTPPSPEECPGLISDLIEWLNNNPQIHPIIKSAIFHHQFVSIHPFSDGNGRMARLLAQWILYNCNFDSQHLLALDEFYAANRQLYYDKIQQCRELDYDFTYWIDYVAEGVLDTLKKVYSRIDVIACSSKGIVLSPKQEELINAFSLSNELTTKQLCELLKVNRARVNHLISPLVKANIIKKIGQARATRYKLSK